MTLVAFTVVHSHSCCRPMTIAGCVLVIWQALFLHVAAKIDLLVQQHVWQSQSPSRTHCAGGHQWQSCKPKCGREPSHMMQSSSRRACVRSRVQILLLGQTSTCGSPKGVIQCLKKRSHTIFGCLLGIMATTPKVLARSRMSMKHNWLPS